MITRRKFLHSSAASGMGLALSGLAAPAIAQGTKIKLGYVSPQTGPLAGFAESDAWNIKAFLASDLGRDFEVIVKDSQSNPNRAAEVAKELILKDGVNLMLAASTPENTNPVAGVCEGEGMPCVTTVAPWQPWFIGQQGNPADPASWRSFDYAFHYFWGMEDVIDVYSAMWNQLSTDKSVGGLFPNDADGNAWGDPNAGLKPGLAEKGYALTHPGSFQNLSDDFSAQINAFKAANNDIITGVLIPPDFATFWAQLRQQGLKPKAVTVAKALLFPQSVESLGDAGHNLSSEVWWSPSHPFSSSLTGQSSAELAKDFETATSRPWTQPIGFVHSLFEVAANVMGRASDVADGDAVAEAISATDMATVVGKVVWNGAGVPEFAAKNVCKTPLTGGQWRMKEGGSYDLVIVENGAAPEIPKGGNMEALS